MQRIAPRIVRVLAVAAVPVLVAGCSGSSDSSNSGSPDDKTKTSASSSPTLEPAKYAELPNPCKALTKDTVKDLVPKSKDVSGDAAKSMDTDARASCSWNGLDGFQYRWLDVAFQRSDSAVGVGSGEDQAKKGYATLKQKAQSPEGLKKGKSPVSKAVPGLGDEAWMVSAEVKKDDEDYRDVTVVARKSNVLVVVSYDGAGFEGSKTPAASGIEEGAVKAAKEALAAVK